VKDTVVKGVHFNEKDPDEKELLRWATGQPEPFSRLAKKALALLKEQREGGLTIRRAGPEPNSEKETEGTLDESSLNGLI